MFSSTVVAIGILAAAYGSYKANKPNKSKSLTPTSGGDALIVRYNSATEQIESPSSAASDAASDRESMLTLWLMLALFRALESTSDFLISGFPFYGVFKLLFVVWIVLPHRTATRSFLFNQWIEPSLAKWEMRFTRQMRAVRSRSADLISHCIRKVLRFGLDHAICHLSAAELERLSDTISHTSKLVKNENTKRLSESVASLFPIAAPPTASAIAAITDTSASSALVAAPVAAAATVAEVEPKPLSSLAAVPENATLSIASSPAPTPAAAEVAVTPTQPLAAVAECDSDSASDKENVQSQRPRAPVAAVAAATDLQPQKAMNLHSLLQRVHNKSQPASTTVGSSDDTATTSADAAPSAVNTARRSKRVTPVAGSGKSAVSASAAARAAKLKRQSIL